MSYPTHEDNRGIFRELIRKKDVDHPICQINYVTINPRQFRGDHFHNILKETFVVLEGECIMMICNVQDDSFCSIVLKCGDVHSVFPGQQHKLYSENGCTILILASEEFDKDNPDVYSI